MSLPTNLLAVDIKVSDFEWAPVAETPAPEVVHTVHTPAPATITAEELDERMRLYVEKLLADPTWHEEQRRKQAEKDARRKAREERLAARQLRKKKAA
jgi:hypothetical protein